MKQENISSYRIGNNASPVYVSNKLIDFKRYWRYHIGTHVKRNLFVLLDENVEKAFPQIISDFFDNEHFNVHLKRLKGGEHIKSLKVASEIWDELSVLTADRSWVMVGIGGGTTTDLTGFTSSAYKRGIPCVFIATSLMAMIDASIGGKNALNQGVLKNQIGTFYFPKFVFVHPPFLKSLPKAEYRSGYAEMLKHALLHKNDNLWKKLSARNIDDLPEISLLAEAIRVKVKIVQKDPYEKNQRLFLNFGHSFAHAIESYYIESKSPISHGEAVAYGMQFALFLSAEKFNASKKRANELMQFIGSLYPIPAALSFEHFAKYLRYDKKILHGKLRIILFKNFGDFEVTYLSEEELKSGYMRFKDALKI